MSTQYNKAAVALIMAVIALVNTWKPGLIPVDESTVNTVVAVLTPLLVFLVPNRPKNQQDQN